MNGPTLEVRAFGSDLRILLTLSVFWAPFTVI